MRSKWLSHLFPCNAIRSQRTQIWPGIPMRIAYDEAASSWGCSTYFWTSTSLPSSNKLDFSAKPEVRATHQCPISIWLPLCWTKASPNIEDIQLICSWPTASSKHTAWDSSSMRAHGTHKMQAHSQISKAQVPCVRKVSMWDLSRGWLLSYCEMKANIGE